GSAEPAKLRQRPAHVWRSGARNRRRRAQPISPADRGGPAVAASGRGRARRGPSPAHAAGGRAVTDDPAARPGRDDSRLTATYVGVMAVEVAILVFLWIVGRIYS